MDFEFSPIVPSEFKGSVKLISGDNTQVLLNISYLIWREGNSIQDVFEIRFEYHCSPFRQAFILEECLAVGYEEHFYLYDLKQDLNLTTIKMDGYFSKLYFDFDSFYVSSASSIYRVTKNGSIVWINTNLGIDGVLINRFDNGKIFGSGEWDPPGRWRDFILNKVDGSLINQNRS